LYGTLIHFQAMASPVLQFWDNQVFMRWGCQAMPNLQCTFTFLAYTFSRILQWHHSCVIHSRPW
jgi:hypothetical protein